MEPTDERYAALQYGIDAIIQRMALLGVRVTLEGDFWDLKDLAERRGATPDPAFDPAEIEPGPLDYWLRMRDLKGHTIACAAARLVEIDDLAETATQGYLWSRTAAPEPLDVIEGALPALSGTCLLTTSAWVEPAWKLTDLPELMMTLTAMIGWRNHKIDHQLNFRLEPAAHADASHPHDTGHAPGDALLEGYLEPWARTVRLRLFIGDSTAFTAQLRDLRARHAATPSAAE